MPSGAKSRILIVTNGPLARNPRVVKEADTLGAAGYDVTVLYVRNHLPSEKSDAALMARAPFRRVVVDASPGASGGAFFQRLSGWLARQAVTHVGWQTLAALGPFSALSRQASRIGSDLTIVHNEVPHGVGLRLARRGRRVCADIEDWHSEDLLPADRKGRPTALLRRQEQALLRELRYTTTTSEALAGALFSACGGNRPHVITNSFPLQPDPRSVRLPDARPPAFFWFSQRLGPGRGLEDFLDAWNGTVQPSRVVLLGEPSPGYRTQLLDRLSPVRRPQVEFRELVEPEDLPEVIAEHDIGLALERSDIPSRNFTITNKILQYLNAGLAVVATDTAGQREVLGRSPAAGILVARGAPSQLTRDLDLLLADRQALRRRQSAARQLAESYYCWEREAPRLLALVEDALG